MNMEKACMHHMVKQHVIFQHFRRDRHCDFASLTLRKREREAHGHFKTCNESFLLNSSSKFELTFKFIVITTNSWKKVK
jgi:hypothetical protein